MKELKSTIENAFEDKISIQKAKTAILKVISELDQGKLRVASKEQGQWVTHQWVKKAILLYFKLQKMSPIKAGDLQFFDKIPLKKWNAKDGVRVVPHALVRKGAFVERGSILMPSYVNIGAFVGSSTMVDTWATVGSCAQIGARVHLSGGVGIGGVLEPLQASPVIIEDDVFVGSRCIVVEGAVIEEGAVLGAGVVITASTKIIDVSSSKERIYTGRVPPRSVVIPGTRPKDFPAGQFQVPCALIIGERSAGTDLKTSLNQTLRHFEVTV
ncbi:MAG: 2,3,4,5-tetrahydropyridine-2,6-dicarboxylate N-succinyltransferase [Oligoflexia bacterium]|nr:2,3,4,5-tetrahydropyridine-2,6-dicarboxylate N-succinyltransferase [Oligoflexia bacterium]